MTLLAIFIALVFRHSLISGRLERTVVTAPIVFTAAGMLVLLLLPELRERKSNPEVFLRIAELGLALLLFTDASHTNLQVLKSIRNLPVRLLSTGMLMTILLGAIAAMVVFRQLTLWEAGILAAILAPTEAGLGQVIVSSPRVPMRIRQALNVEAGLNDGLSVPFLLFFIFGLLVARDCQHFTAPLVLYAVLSLTVVRMLPVAITLMGTRLSRATLLFMGWFGPRGLASIVLAMVYLEQGTQHPGQATIRFAVMVTVLLSIFAPGLSAMPGVRLYAAKVAALDAGVPELQAPGAGTAG